MKGAWTGPATLELEPHALAPVAALPVHEIVSAAVVYDYLQDR
jgi:acetoacetate decarboxylase